MKTNVIIAIVIAVVILIVLMSKKGTSAQSQAGLQGDGYYPPGQFIPSGGGPVAGSDPIIDLIADSTRVTDCKTTCKNLCKPFRPIIKRKKHCKDPCRSDCTKGMDVISMYP